MLVASLAGWQLYRADQTYKYASSRKAMMDLGLALQDSYRTRGHFDRTLPLRELAPGLPTVDAWGAEFRIEMANDHFTLTSFGSDRKEGGTGSAEDIVVQWKASRKEMIVRSASLAP